MVHKTFDSLKPTPEMIVEETVIRLNHDVIAGRFKKLGDLESALNQLGSLGKAVTKHPAYMAWVLLFALHFIR